MPNDLITQAAIELVARRNAARQGPRLPEAFRPTDLEGALQVQQEVTRLLGKAVGGWKASMPGAGKLVAAPIYAPTISRSAVYVVPGIAVAASPDVVNIEPEIAFVLAHDLPPRAQAYPAAEVDAAIGSVHAALEICASRYTDHTGFSFPEMLADGLVNCGLWLGPALTSQAPASFELTWQAGDGPPLQLHATHPDGHPRAPLYWLVNFLSERGIGLKAGQVVITGSYAGLLKAPVGDALQFDYAGLAQFELRFCLETESPGKAA